MDSRSAPAWGEQRRAPVRARGAKDGGGAPGPSTIKGERRMDQKFLKRRVFSCRRTLGRAMRRKARRLALAEAPILFFSVVLCWHYIKMCECLLATPSFQCIGGGSVPPPMPCRTLGRAACRKACRLALAEALNLFSLSYCVGTTLKCVNVCLQCPVFNALGAAVCRPRCLAGRWAGRRAKRRVVWPWRRRRIFFFCRIVLAKR